MLFQLVIKKFSATKEDHYPNESSNTFCTDSNKRRMSSMKSVFLMTFLVHINTMTPNETNRALLADSFFISSPFWGSGFPLVTDTTSPGFRSQGSASILLKTIILNCKLDIANFKFAPLFPHPIHLEMKDIDAAGQVVRMKDAGMAPCPIMAVRKDLHLLTGDVIDS